LFGEFDPLLCQVKPRAPSFRIDAFAGHLSAIA
jgi:hypothetical protein